jgi:integrase
MAKRSKGYRVYWRETGGARRAYGDFRAVGGGREALVARGETAATTDPKLAGKLAALRYAELHGAAEKKRVLGAALGIRETAELKTFAAEHLAMKARSGMVTELWLAAAEKHLTAAVEFFGAARPLHEMSVADVQRFATFLQTYSNSRGGTLSPGTARHYLNSLSNLFRRAQAEGVVPPGFNPVGAMMEKPVGRPKEARWLEVSEAALLLESARTYRPKRDDMALPFAHALFATFLLTGGRESEVLGLEVEDVSFDRKTITFRPNRWRRLKTGTSHRTVPLWPQLEEILRAHVFGGAIPKVSGLLFPAQHARVVGERMITDVRKPLDAIASRAGWKAGDVRTKAFRHTYCAARLQTLDGGAPVSVYTVAKELGHGGDSLVKRVYGHLGQVRHRAEVVEYRVEQHRGEIAERLDALV